MIGLHSGVVGIQTEKITARLSNILYDCGLIAEHHELSEVPSEL
jgi:hypothetical protein